MKSSVREALLEINRRFYAERADAFSRTRGRAWSGFEGLLRYIDDGSRVLDLGCGNGRLPAFVASRRREIRYVGVDFSSELLALAREEAAGAGLADASFRHGDLATAVWSEDLAESSFDFVALIAVLQHVPGRNSRLRLIEQAAALTTDAGCMAIANWQFMDSDRMRSKIVEWSRVGINPDEVDAGDHLLDWRSGGLSYRYCHMVDADEVDSLAGAAGMEVACSYRADGFEGDQNLYSILRRSHHHDRERPQRQTRRERSAGGL